MHPCLVMFKNRAPHTNACPLKTSARPSYLQLLGRTHRAHMPAVLGPHLDRPRKVRTKGFWVWIGPFSDTLGVRSVPPAPSRPPIAGLLDPHRPIPGPTTPL